MYLRIYTYQGNALRGTHQHCRSTQFLVKKDDEATALKVRGQRNLM